MFLHGDDSDEPMLLLVLLALLVALVVPVAAAGAGRGGGRAAGPVLRRPSAFTLSVFGFGVGLPDIRMPSPIEVKLVTQRVVDPIHYGNYCGPSPEVRRGLAAAMWAGRVRRRPCPLTSSKSPRPAHLHRSRQRAAAGTR